MLLVCMQLPSSEQSGTRGGPSTRYGWEYKSLLYWLHTCTMSCVFVLICTVAHGSQAMSFLPEMSPAQLWCGLDKAHMPWIEEVGLLLQVKCKYRNVSITLSLVCAWNSVYSAMLNPKIIYSLWSFGREFSYVVTAWRLYLLFCGIIHTLASLLMYWEIFLQKLIFGTSFVRYVCTGWHREWPGYHLQLTRNSTHHSYTHTQVKSAKGIGISTLIDTQTRGAHLA